MVNTPTVAFPSIMEAEASGQESPPHHSKTKEAPSQSLDFPSTSENQNVDTESAQERLKKFKQSQVDLSTVEDDINKIINAIEKNPSLISRAAHYWGELPIWQKIIAGVLLAAPSLAVGILGQFVVCFVITAFIVAGYIGSSILLDDHHNHTKHSTKNIAGLTNLAKNLDIIKQIMLQLSTELAVQVNAFSQENIKFGTHVDDLSQKNKTLSQEVTDLTETKEKLLLTQKGLEDEVVQFKKSLQEQTDLAQETQSALNKLKVDFELNNTLLEEKTTGLDNINKRFRLKVEEYDQVISTLNSTISELVTLIHDTTPGRKESFYTNIENFIKIKDNNFLQLFDGISKQIKDLASQKERYEKSIDQYETLLEKHRILVDKYEAEIERLNQPSHSSLRTQSIYASPRPGPARYQVTPMQEIMRP